MNKPDGGDFQHISRSPAPCVRPDAALARHERLHCQIVVDCERLDLTTIPIVAGAIGRGRLARPFLADD